MFVVYVRVPIVTTACAYSNNCMRIQYARAVISPRKRKRPVIGRCCSFVDFALAMTPSNVARHFVLLAVTLSIIQTSSPATVRTVDLTSRTCTSSAPNVEDLKLALSYSKFLSSKPMSGRPAAEPKTYTIDLRKFYSDKFCFLCIQQQCRQKMETISAYPPT